MFIRMQKPLSRFFSSYAKSATQIDNSKPIAQFNKLERLLFANKNPVRCIAFDGGGTVSPFCYEPLQSFQHGFMTKQIELTPAQVRKDMGLPKEAHIDEMTREPSILDKWLQVHQQAPTDKDKADIYVAYLAKQRKLLQDTLAVPGMAEVIKKLRKDNIYIALNTAYSREETLIFVEALKAQGIEFDFIVTNSDVKKGRPFPFMLHRIAEYFGLAEPQELLVVGDTTKDILAAHNHYPNVASCGYSSELNINSIQHAKEIDPTELKTRRNNTIQKLRTYGANYHMIEPEELLRIVSDLNYRIETKNFNAEETDYTQTLGEDGLQLRVKI